MIIFNKLDSYIINVYTKNKIVITTETICYIKLKLILV